MSLKALSAAGQFAGGLVQTCQTANSLANQYASQSSPLMQLLASAGLTASIPDSDANKAAIATLAASVALPSDASIQALSAGFGTQEVADAKTIMVAALVGGYVIGKLAATLPANDL